jgi:hypothetical protein
MQALLMDVHNNLFQFLFSKQWTRIEATVLLFVSIRGNEIQNRLEGGLKKLSVCAK